MSRAVLQAALAVLGFVSYWPALQVLSARRRARYEERRRQLGAGKSGRAKLAAGEVKAATQLLHTTHTMASGFETDGLWVLELASGTLVVPDEEATRQALTAAKIPTTTIASEEHGVSGVMAWLFWCAIALAALALWDEPWTRWVLLGSAVVGLIALAMRPASDPDR